MDYTLSFLIASILATVGIFVSLIVYARRLRTIYNDLTRPTARALVFFGMAGISLGLIPTFSTHFTNFIQPIVAFTLASILASEINLVLTEEKSIRRATLFTYIYPILIFIYSIFGSTLGVPVIVPMVVLVSLLGFVTLTSLYLIRESPNPFSISVLLIIISLMLSAITAMRVDVFGAPQFYLFLLLPFAVGVGVYGTLLRPWRHIVSYAIGMLTLVIGVPVVIASLLAGDTIVSIVVGLETFVAVSALVPLDTFIQQAAETRNATPFYISFTLASMALLVTTHSYNFALANGGYGVWDETILYIDWVIGVLAVSSFTMAAVSTRFPPTIRHAIREVLIAVGFSILALGHPLVRWYGDIQRWELDPLYTVLIVQIIFSFIVFGSIARNLVKVGAGGAAARFLLFMFASLLAGIVAMFADLLPLEALVPLLLFSGILLIGSNPRLRIRSE